MRTIITHKVAQLLQLFVLSFLRQMPGRGVSNIPKVIAQRSIMMYKE